MADLDLSGRRLGEFVLVERIGAGGHGTVYRCEQPVLQRDAVVKVLHTRLRRNDTAEQRFLREAKLASRLDHPYAAHVYSFGVEADGLSWIAMEFVQGDTLDVWLKARGRMAIQQFVPFFDAVAQVVQAAHDRAIVHRDLKPSNIMVTESGGCLFPKLLDFGIAKLNETADEPDGDDDDLPRLESADHVSTQRTRSEDRAGSVQITRPGIVIGSAPYMSPEQWGTPYAVGPASDVYSLGCVAYEALTGRTPFTATNTREYYKCHLASSPPTLGNDFSPGLDRVLKRALAKAPELRYASALELASELRAAVRAEPREQLSSAAQQWHDHGRPAGLLWRQEMLTGVERWAQPDSSDARSEIRCSFVAACQRRARRMRWARSAVVVLVAAGALGILLYYLQMRAHLAQQQAHLAAQQARLAEQQTRAARDRAEARLPESELEQGRAALLHGETEAQAHLAEAYKRDPAAATGFMLARSMEPRLAERARFASTYGRMWWATFSPNGRQIATADDRAAQVWDAQTYRLLFTIPHGCEVYQVLYSADSAKLVTVTEATVSIWDARNGALLHDLTAKARGTSSDFYRAEISPDGRVVAGINAKGSVTYAWDVESGFLVAEIHNRGTGTPRLAFSPLGWLATTGGDDVHVVDVHAWKQILTLRGPIRSLAFDAGRLATGSATGEVVLWAVPTGRKIRQLHQFGDPVEALAFSPDGELIAAGTREGAIQVWQVGSGAPRSQLNPRHSRIFWLEFDTVSRRLLAANADGTIVIADAVQGLPVAVLDGPKNFVRVARFDANSRVVAASSDGTARVWDATPSYRRWSSAPAGDACNIGLGTEPDRRFMAVGCKDLPTQVWDTAHNQLLAVLPSATPIAIPGFTSALPAVSSRGDLAAIARGTAVDVYEVTGRRLLRAVEHRAAVSAIAFAEAGTAMVSGALEHRMV